MVENLVIQDPRFNFVFVYTDTSVPADSVARISGVNAPSSRVYTSGNGWNPPIGAPSQGVIGFSYNTNSFVFGGPFQISNSTETINVSSYAGVVSGLVLALDAGFTPSYPGSGSTWSDVSGNSNNGTLVNTPTYSSIVGRGSLLFNGSTQYVNISNSASLGVTATFTICAWVYATSLSSRHGIFSTRATNQAGGWQLEVGIANGGTNRVAITGVGTWIAETVSNVITTGQWFYICVVKVNNATTGATIYVNNVAAANNLTTAYTISNNADVKRIGSGTNTLEFFPGYIAEVDLYNRTLTTAELLQNYTSSCSRYGYTSAISNYLQLFLDAGNYSSYSGTGSTWSDASGNGYNGTLFSSPTYSSTLGGGSFAFNGTTQYVDTTNTGTAFQYANTSFTVSLWINTSSTTAGIIVSKGATASTGGWLVQFDAAGTITGSIKGSAGSSTFDRTSSVTVNNNTWTNVVVIFTTNTTTLASNTVSIYINSVLSNGTGTLGSVVYATTADTVQIGRRPSGNYWAGSTSIVLVNNRALSLLEIQRNFNSAFLRFTTPPPIPIVTQRAIFGYGWNGSAYYSLTNLVSNTGVVAADTTGVGSARYGIAAASYGTDKAIFGFGFLSTFTDTGITNLVSNTGVVATDTAAVGTARRQIAAAGYGVDKAIFSYGTSSGGARYFTNLVSNTGVVASDVGGVGTSRSSLAAAGYGTDKALFGFGMDFSFNNLSTTNLISNAGVVAANTTGVGTVRRELAAAGYGNDKAIFGYGRDAGSSYSVTNLVSNTGVVATDTTGVGTARSNLAAAIYGGDKAIFGYGAFGTVYSITNLVSNTGVVAADTTGVGTIRYQLAAAGYSLT